jgi:membrane-associated protease RseP (regulator of RpoE activity)
MRKISSLGAAFLSCCSLAIAQQNAAQQNTTPPVPAESIPQTSNATPETPPPPPVGSADDVRNDDAPVSSAVNGVRNATAGSQQSPPSNRTFANQPATSRAALGVTLAEDMTINRVQPGSPAARMGLQVGDRLITLNGERFDSADLMIASISQQPLDQDVEIVFDRNGQESRMTGRLDSWQMVFAGSSSAQPYSAMRPIDNGTMNGATAPSGTVSSDNCCCGAGQAAYPATIDYGYAPTWSSNYAPTWSGGYYNDYGPTFWGNGYGYGYGYGW